MTRRPPARWTPKSLLKTMAAANLLLLPGLLCDASYWQPQIKGLGTRAQCLVADYGMADSLEAMARMALAQADAAGLHGPLAVAAHSMGGRVAFELLRIAPQRVERLALLDTGFHPFAGGEAGDKERAGRMALVRQGETEGMRAMGQVWAKGMVHPAHLHLPLFEDILQMIERKSPAQFAAQQNALLTRRDATPQLATITCPTLVLCGREDAWSGPPQHQVMHRAIAGSVLRIIEDCGHMCTLEQPEAVTQALAEWLVM